MTAGFRTIDLIGRFWCVPFHLQHAHVLRKSATSYNKSIAPYVSAMKMCIGCSASFSYSRLALSTSLLRMSLFRATTLLITNLISQNPILIKNDKKSTVIGQTLNVPNFKSRIAIVLASTGARYLKRGILSVCYFREVPSLKVPHLQPMAAVEYCMRDVWCGKTNLSRSER